MTQVSAEVPTNRVEWVIHTQENVDGLQIVISPGLHHHAAQESLLHPNLPGDTFRTVVKPRVVAILGPRLVKVAVFREDLGAGQEHETHQLQSQHPRHLFARSIAGKRGNEFPGEHLGPVLPRRESRAAELVVRRGKNNFSPFLLLPLSRRMPRGSPFPPYRSPGSGFHGRHCFLGPLADERRPIDRSRPVPKSLRVSFGTTCARGSHFRRPASSAPSLC